MINKRYRSGETHPKCKLRRADVLTIRRAYDLGGQTYRSLALRYGVSCSAINDILNHRTWRNIAPTKLEDQTK